jgi:hypothetical protein
VSEHRDALAWANAQVAGARDDPAVRLALMERVFHGPTGRAPRHLPFRRAALSFMRWQAQRGLLGDPRLGMVGAFLSLSRVIPNHYPLTRDVEWYIADEQRLGRLFDYAVIAPRLERLYEWSAKEIGESRLLGLVRNGSPIYAWSDEQRHVWRAQRLPFPGRVLERVTRAR